MAPETKEEVTVTGTPGSVGDRATATETVLPPDRVIPPTDNTGEIVTLLGLSRKNGTGDSGEIDLGPEGFSGSVKCNVVSLFGEPDGDVHLDVRVNTREDTTEKWEEAASWIDIVKTGEQTKSVKLKRRASVTYTVYGSDGGHAVDLEVYGKRSS